MTNRVHLIFSGFNQRAVIAFIRTLNDQKLPYAIIAKSESDSILQSAYKSNVFSIRKVAALNLNDIISSINEIKQMTFAKEYIIAPSTESLNRFVLDHKEKFNELNCLIPLPTRKLYQTISDKYSFGELCLNNGIKVPDCYKSVHDVAIPFVAKPFKYFSTGNNIYSPILILNENEKINFINMYKADDFFYQKFVSGNSLYLLYYFHRNGTIYKYSQENIIQQPDGKSIIAAKSSNFHTSVESSKYEQLLKKINYHGFIMIEVRQDKSQNYMIEANPRFWGPSQLFVDAKRNFFEAFLNDYGNLCEPPVFPENRNRFYYFWFGGFLQSFKNGQEPVFHKGNEKKILLKLPKWLKSDIYNRTDTVDIFKTELQ